jgi:hypothetical protein
LFDHPICGRQTGGLRWGAYVTVAAKHDHPDVAVPRDVAVGDTAQLPGRAGQLNYRYVVAIVAATVFLAARKYLHNACVARARVFP